MTATASCIVMRSQRHVSSAPDLMTCTWPAGLTQMLHAAAPVFFFYVVGKLLKPRDVAPGGQDHTLSL